MKYFTCIPIALFFATIARGMDNPQKLVLRPSKNIIFFSDMPSFPRIFGENIPTEINGTIMDTLSFRSQNLAQGAYSINRFSSTCIGLTKIINENTPKIITLLSQAYRCSNECAASALHIKSASKILIKQLGFITLIITNKDLSSYNFSNSFLHAKKNNIDLNFTYGDNSETLLMLILASRRSSPPIIVDSLIKNGTNINIADSNGTTAPFIAIEKWIMGNEKKQLIEYFWDLPEFNINEIRGKGFKRTLLFSFIYQRWILEYNSHNYAKAEKLAFIEKLCAKGADPELMHKKKNGHIRTPLSLAQQVNDPELIKVIEKEISKKHALLAQKDK